MPENKTEERPPQLDNVRDNATQEDFKMKNKVWEMLEYAGPQLEEFPRAKRGLVLRHLIRLAASTKYTRSGKPCLPMKKYEMMARYINEIGCMVGGYYKSLNGSTSGNGSAAK